MTTPKITWEQSVLSLRNRPNMQEFIRACYYDDPILQAAQRYHSSAEWQAVRRILPLKEENATVLDIGSGRGISAYAFARDGWSTFALEPDPSAVVGAAAIRNLYSEGGVMINVYQEWGESLPFVDAFFDVVHCRAVLHHARDLGKFMLEVSRVLKPGGTFIGIREHVVSNHEDIAVFQERHPLHPLYGGEYAYLLDEYVNSISGAGLLLTQVLNPLESDINTAPSTMKLTKVRWAARIGLPVLANFIPDGLLKMRASISDTPGRLYSFVATKDC